MEAARLLLIAVLLAAVHPGCDETIPEVGPSPFQIRFTGRVLDYSTQAPVAAATLAFGLMPDGATSSQTVTNADGTYVAVVPRTGAYTVTIDGAGAGLAQVNGTAYRGDLLRSRNTCIARYGVVIDSRTLRPIRGATVTLVGSTATTGIDGWYRIDVGCPDLVLPGGTTVITASHPEYETRSQVVGRGVSGVLRLDLDVEAR